jgi:three-Cys-motif partner protein
MISTMNYFGGKWTKDKIDVFIKYTKAYLEIMKDRPYFSLIYFDGFAGSGAIMHNGNEFDLLIGVAGEILEIDEPRIFDIYYFVEKNQDNAHNLDRLVKTRYPDRNAFVVPNDCNNRLRSLANFLARPQNKKYRVLAFLDPYGMQINWGSLEALKGFGVDMWILVPTGIGVTRLLKKDGNIESGMMQRLTTFLGLEKEEIIRHFYQEISVQNLFGEKETIFVKEEKVVNKAADLYLHRLQDIFKHVSKPLVMKNSKGSIMYHFLMCSNNPTAVRIANDIVKPKFQ